MSGRARTIEVDEATADAFEARAAERGVSVAELLADLAAFEAQAWPKDIEAMRAAGEGPWSPEALAEDERALADFERTGEGIPFEDFVAWLRSLGGANPLPRPLPRKL
ncbi:MAG TPA: hypothetical protein VF601_21890 [Beijerinckiaceae bacterium]|jgi:hypothetical protein